MAILKDNYKLVLGSLFAAAVLALSCLSTPQICYAKVPSGYHANDYQKLRNFLELPNGTKKNGNMIGGSRYNCNNPATWSGVAWNKATPKRITRIDWHENGLVGNLDMSGCKALKYINCNHNQLKSLNVHSCKKLKEISCLVNQLSSLKVTECVALETIDCSYNLLTSLNANISKILQKLDCDNNQLSNLNLDGCQKLNELSCFKNRLTKLNLNNCRALRELQCFSNKLSSLNVKSCPELNKLGCYENQLRTLDLNGCPKLAELNCYNNYLTFASLSIAFSLPRGMFNCLPQADILIGIKGEVVVNEVIDLSREANVGKVATEFIWYNARNQIIKPSTAMMNWKWMCFKVFILLN